MRIQNSENGCVITSYLDDIYHIETSPLVFSTLIVGTKSALLVDTGLGLCDLDRCVGEIIGNRALFVVNTHGHLDHILGNYQFPVVYINEQDVAWQVPFSLSDESKRRVLARERCEEPYHRLDEFISYKGENLRFLEENEFRLGGITVAVVGIPNHTKGSIGLYVKEKGLLVSGDALAPCISLLFPESETLEEHIYELEKLSSLPFQHILSSHNERLLSRSVLDLAIKCAKKYDPDLSIGYSDPFYPEFKGRLYTYFENGNSEDATFIICKEEEGK